MSSRNKTIANNEEATTALEPKRRFPEFRGAALRSVRLGDVTEEGRLRNGKKHSVASVMGVTKANGIVPMEARLIAADIERYKIVEHDWFAYNPMRLNIGSIARWEGESEILVSPDYVVFKCITDDESGIAPGYIDHFRQTKAWEDFVTEGGDGGVRVRIYYKDIARLQLGLPSLPEQKKIAECLSSVDELIAAQARKVDSLRTLKRGLMQQLFPREGETQPRLRFPEFQDAGDWEEKRLEDLTKRGSGHTPSKSNPEYYNGGIKWVSLADSKRLDGGLIAETAIEISEQGIQNSSAVLHPAGTVLISRDAGIGKSAVMDVPMAVSQHFIAWTCNPCMLFNWFLYHLLQNSKPLFERAATGSTIKTIGLQFFVDLVFRIPSLPEQQRIAHCFTSLDDLITAQSDKLNALRAYKRGLMQQLFPSTIEASI
ncbi:restriction endonuclease subunit S [Paraburkholderia sp. 31.1]|uniref:restriction endonuclease subunit S n=1 Tax=Paraburkholderia sp. 31.1 TaxID=2615205 RepID=UPI001655D30C|nr:restriction endonuclease subunit S [Paraburkholderia sp. 31.1]MBC8723908.1 restriction endonuclease subunit S [Paraburkholderia sp. 31.1]